MATVNAFAKRAAAQVARVIGERQREPSSITLLPGSEANLMSKISYCYRRGKEVATHLELLHIEDILRPTQAVTLAIYSAGNL